MFEDAEEGEEVSGRGGTEEFCGVVCKLRTHSSANCELLSYGFSGKILDEEGVLGCETWG